MKHIALNFRNAARHSFWGQGPVVYWVSQQKDGSKLIMTDSIIMECATASNVYLEATTKENKIMGLDLVCENYRCPTMADPISRFKIGLDTNNEVTLG